MRTTTTLHDGWTVTATAGDGPAERLPPKMQATVPGCVHTDLLEAGQIADPYLDRNEHEQDWIHRAGWRYEQELELSAVEADERLTLVFEGLDTVAAVSFADVELGRSENMHREYRYDVSPLAGTAGTLQVEFSPALILAQAREAELGARPHAYPHPYNMVRKMACSFGWDWGPDLQSAGIWRPVHLDRWRVARLATVRPMATLREDGTGVVTVHVEVERAPTSADVPLVVEVRLETGQQQRVELASGETKAALEFDVPSAPAWWPRGHGVQPLVGLEIRLARAEADGDALDALSHRIGFRRVEALADEDEHGTSFVLRINGRPIEVKGANWIPDEHLVTRMNRERYEQRIRQATEANLNLLRVWGGGIYESRDFYELCDAYGILVWQDFMLACAAYPEEEPLRTELVAEARENVSRLAPHPSLVVWSGGNENLWSRVDYWDHKLQGATWGEWYYYSAFPQVVAELAPHVAYIEGSPHSPGAALDAIHPNHPDHGTMHIWDVWNAVDYTGYLNYIPRLCAEFGFQGPAAWSTLLEAVPGDQAPSPTSPGLLNHQKADAGQDKLVRGYDGHFPEPEGLADWHWTTQLNQARAVAFGIRHFRSYWPRSSGSIVWQLNDCWPAISWAAIDHEARLKPLWYAMRDAYAPRLLTIQPRDGGCAAVAINDTDAPWSGTLELWREAFDGAEQWHSTHTLEVPPRSGRTVLLPAEATAPRKPAHEVLVATLDGTRAFHFFAEDRELQYHPEPVEAVWEPDGGGGRVVVTARSLARDVFVLADRLAPDAVAAQGLLTLRVGESVVIDIRSAAAITAESLVGSVRSANDLIHR